MAHVYIRVWEYEVAAAHIDAFLAAYGSEGEWARLFERGRGYVGTELYRGTDDQSRFVTVDRWTDECAWRAFLEEAREAYDGLDEGMTHLSTFQHDLLEGPH
jgi:heme-degrading monooxygenase HmoA